MKDSLIGIVTLSVILGVVWISQKDVETTDLTSNVEPVQQVSTFTKEIKDDIVEMKTDLEAEIDAADKETSLSACDLCNTDMGYNDDLDFKEAFKQCRLCLGSNDEFMWKGKLYSTKIKEEYKTINLVEKEDADLISPPNNETVDSE